MEENLIQFLLSIGAMESVGIDSSGEVIYKLTDRAKELVPELYEEHMKDFHAAVFSLWSKNIINISFNNDGDPLIGLNDNSKNLEKTKNLPENEKQALEEIVAYWQKENRRVI